MAKDKGLPETFDAEGMGYDTVTAKAYGLKPNKAGHWQSRIPSTGLLLKGKQHPTWNLLEEGEKKAGYKIIKKGSRYYSFPDNSIKK